MIDILFSEQDKIELVQHKLPTLFELAEADCSRAGKLGMEIGSTREKILIALLIHLFGVDNVKTDLPITEPETDVILDNQPISIKTMTGSNLTGIKLIWTVDPGKALEFKEHYIPSVDILFVQIQWGSTGYVYLIPKEAQVRVFEEMGRDLYIKMPKEGTNPRGVELSKEALRKLVTEDDVKKIPIEWKKSNNNCDIYARWVELWEN